MRIVASLGRCYNYKVCHQESPSFSGKLLVVCGLKEAKISTMLHGRPSGRRAPHFAFRFRPSCSFPPATRAWPSAFARPARTHLRHAPRLRQLLPSVTRLVPMFFGKRALRLAFMLFIRCLNEVKRSKRFYTFKKYI